MVKNNIRLRFIKQVYIALLSFSGTSATKCLSLNNQLCAARPMFIDLNPKNSLDDPSGT